MKRKILIIDDDLDLSLLLNRFLTRNGYEVEEANSGAKGIDKFKKNNFDIVICDYRLGDKEGREVLEEIKIADPTAIVLIITGYSDIKTAVEVIKSGAYDYIAKPLVPDEILAILSNITKELMLKSNGAESVKTAGKQSAQKQFLEGRSKAAKELYRQVDIVACTDYSVILYGESGTGKEVIAKTIHNTSNRKNKPFVAIDCGTLSKELAGSELFGHMKGSFTGALNDKEGHFEMANGGTLFLDEVGNLSSDIQASLLRVIQERRFKRVGGTKEMPLDIRVIVASNENLQESYKKGKFREDLYHRFNEFAITLPRLSQRKEDIPLFADFFLQKTKAELEKQLSGFEDEVMEFFVNYAWPGNLREMRNVIRRAALLSGVEKINLQALPYDLVQGIDRTAKDDNYTQRQELPADDSHIFKRDINLKDRAAKAEYDAILTTLEMVNFNKSKAAELLNIDRKTLYNKIRAYGGSLTNSLSSE